MRSIRGRTGDHGTLRSHRRFVSKMLDNERELLVWLPPGYHRQCRARLPVNYAQDGQNLFDPATAFADVA